MDSDKLSHFDAAAFLIDAWQKTTYLIHQGLPLLSIDFDQHDLAGLALEESIDSRVVIEQQDGSYALRHGPFEESSFAQIDAVEAHKTWTLLVQSVDHYIPEVADLKRYFSFLPNWRLDDIMISYAKEGGSVGPHFDYYDVFLIQLQGERLWKIGQLCDEHTSLKAHPDLKLLESFDEQIEYSMSAGDVLYVPPGVAHWGIAQSDDCMTISVGFRAPSYADMAMSVADDMALTVPKHVRYQDDVVHHVNECSASEISSDTIHTIQSELMRLALDAERIASVFGGLMTESHNVDVNGLEQAAMAPQKVSTPILEKHLDTRMAFTRLEDTLLLFANGRRMSLPMSQYEFVDTLCAQNTVDLRELDSNQQEVVGFLINCNVYDLYMDEE
ncbi:MAG: cupin domain-containing protein [Pseudomonadota bacterium]